MLEQTHAMPTEASTHAPARRNAFRSWIDRVFREPLFHFLLLALVVVVAERVYANAHDSFRIVMTPQRVQQLAASYRLQYGIEPGPNLREALVQQDVEDEVLFRQALALQLDVDDPIVRRRLIQKMQFIAEDQHAPAEPTIAQLDAYFASHRERYRTSPTATFTHVFFSTDVAGEADARSRAAEALEELNRSGSLREPSAGDAFPDRYDFSAYEPQQVSRLFGQTEFTDAVFSAPVGVWSGPFQSAYGWHLLRVDSRQAASDPPLADVQDRVRADYFRDVQDATNAATLATLKEQFVLVRQDLAP